MGALILRILLFLIPFVLFYLLMRYLKRRKAAGDPGEAELENNIGSAALVGIALLIGALIYMAVSTNPNTDLNYTPPKEVDGEIEPAHLDPEKD